jgi:hypothetical protein
MKQTLREVHECLRALYGDRLVRVVLYSSLARGDARPDSDVDVLVILKGPVRVIEEIKRLAPFKLDLLEQSGLYFSFQPFSEEAYADRERPLMMNVHAEGIEL